MGTICNIGGQDEVELDMTFGVSSPVVGWRCLERGGEFTPAHSITTHTHTPDMLEVYELGTKNVNKNTHTLTYRHHTSLQSKSVF